MSLPVGSPAYRTVSCLVMAALCVCAAGIAAAQVTMKRVGGEEMAVRILGKAGPWIVFESGLDEGIDAWKQVAPALAACARVVLYDRPGIGHSAPRTAGGPVLASAVADRLAALLAAIDATPPYILVGHSLGGLYVQSFARRYPTSVSGIVLVDAASPYEPPGVFVSTVPPVAGSIAAAEEAGVAPSVRTMLAGPPFPPVPLIVLAATDHGDTSSRESVWREVQERAATLSPRGRLEVVQGSGHFIQNDRPRAVIQAVLGLARESGADISACTAN